LPPRPVLLWGPKCCLCNSYGSCISGIKRPEREANYSPSLLQRLRMSGDLLSLLFIFLQGVVPYLTDNFRFLCPLKRVTFLWECFAVFSLGLLHCNVLHYKRQRIHARLKEISWSHCHCRSAKGGTATTLLWKEGNSLSASWKSNYRSPGSGTNSSPRVP